MVQLKFLFLLLTSALVLCREEVEIDCSFTRIWGPGLDPENIVMPARYFFIEAAGVNNTSLTESPGKNTFEIEIFSKEQKSCRLWIEMLDRKDGSFIVRYKIFEICKKLVISVKCQNKKTFLYPFEGITYPDECKCYQHDDINDWLKMYGCSKNWKQIDSDLKPFTNIDFDTILPVAQTTLFNEPHKHSVCHYVIKNNQINRACYGQYTGFKMFMDAILLSLTRKVRFPDLEFLVNLGDWPLIKDTVKFNDSELLLPVFSWCGSSETWDIILPTYDLTESSLENMGRVMLDMLSVQGNIDKTWHYKIPKMFWRGRDASRERLKLVKIAREHGHLINASLTNFFFFKDLEDEYGPTEDRISFFKFFNYKYQLNMDGTVAAYRFPYLLVSDSLVFKQDSMYYEHFYSDLRRWVHFIPVKRDLSDLIEKLTWAVEHDNEAENIARKGQYYARNNLLPQDVFCYHVKLFYEYSLKMAKKSINIRPNMEPVYENNPTHCNCDFGTTRDEL